MSNVALHGRLIGRAGEGRALRRLGWVLDWDIPKPLSQLLPRLALVGSLLYLSEDDLDGHLRKIDSMARSLPRESRLPRLIFV